MVHCVVGS